MTSAPLALTSALLTAHGFDHAFFTRAGGVSAAPFASLSFVEGTGDEGDHVRQNRALASAYLRVATDKLLYLSQVHGVLHYEAGEDDGAAETARREGDILLSGSPGVACGVRTADCVPVLLAQPRTGAVAAVHAGWRGAVADAPGIGARLLRARFGDAPIVAAIGPHISAVAFEIGPDAAVALRAADTEGTVVAMRDGRLTADLAALVCASLRRAGIDEVDTVPGCTFLEPLRFFSYRRDGASSGRHVSAIVARAGVG